MTVLDHAQFVACDRNVQYCARGQIVRFSGVQKCTATELSHQVQYHESDWTCENVRDGRASMIEMTFGTVETTDPAKWWETPAWNSSSCRASCRAIQVLESLFVPRKYTEDTQSLRRCLRMNKWVCARRVRPPQPSLAVVRDPKRLETATMGGRDESCVIALRSKSAPCICQQDCGHGHGILAIQRNVEIYECHDGVATSRQVDSDHPSCAEAIDGLPRWPDRQVCSSVAKDRRLC